MPTGLVEVMRFSRDHADRWRGPLGLRTLSSWPQLASSAEASGCLVGPAVFKTVEGVTSPLAGSIPVRLRYSP